MKKSKNPRSNNYWKFWKHFLENYLGGFSRKKKQINLETTLTIPAVSEKNSKSRKKNRINIEKKEKMYNLINKQKLELM